MPLNAVIFDIDGVLIDSEPFWEEAGQETLAKYGIELNADQFSATTGLRSKEWVEWWFDYFKVDRGFAKEAGYDLLTRGVKKIRDHAVSMPGVDYIFQFFAERNFTIGLATSSPETLIDVVIEKLQIGKYINAFSSGVALPQSKPHPQVYLDCAEKLNVSPQDCLCFEDSYNGMIAAKAARMKCVIIPAARQYHHEYWNAANFKINSFFDFNETLLERLKQ